MPTNTDHTARLAEIEGRVQAATPGPWQRSVFMPPRSALKFYEQRLELVEKCRNLERRTIRGPGFVGKPECNPVLRVTEGETQEEDLTLIAHAPADLTYLLARVRELKAENEQLLTDLRYLDPTR